MAPPVIDGKWIQAGTVGGRRFTCGYCGADVHPTTGYMTDGHSAYLLICPCKAPTLFDAQRTQFPRPRVGKEIPNLPPDVARIYNEIRESMGVGAYLGASLLARTLLLHVAVDRSAKDAAKPGTFNLAIDRLVELGLVTPAMRPWVDTIKDKGNEAGHEINTTVTEAQATNLLHFVEMLLSVAYDFPSRMPLQ